MSKVTLEEQHEFKTGCSNVFGMDTSPDDTLIITGRRKTDEGMLLVVRIFSGEEGKLLTEFQYAFNCLSHLFWQPGLHTKNLLSQKLQQQLGTATATDP